MGAVLSQAFPWSGLLLLLVLVRLTKGVAFADAYALVSRPFWPGPSQQEWLRSSQRLAADLRLSQLAQDNARLRGLLDLGQVHSGAIQAAVISREVDGWWQQILLNKGTLAGLRVGDVVEGPGGLVGLVGQVSLSTATVTLLTDPASRIGVWVARTRQHGLLSGVGTSRPVLRFLDKDPQVRPGDVVLTSPASTLVPPNLPVGVVQSIDQRANPAPEAIVQLSAPVDAIDWVEVLVRRSP
jgi:rod shape-determining protein MreC